MIALLIVSRDSPTLSTLRMAASSRLASAACAVEAAA